jgi:hypothetical protein
MRLGKGSKVHAIVTSLALSLTAIPVHAEPSAVEKETARTLMNEGRAARASGDVAAALKAFEGAHKIMGVPTTGLEYGRALYDAKRWVEARDVLLAVGRSQPSPGEPAVFAEARDSADALAAELAPRIPTLRIEVKGVAPTAIQKIELDGRPVTVAPGMPIKVDPTEHVAVVHVRGVQRSAKENFAEGQTKALVIDFAGVDFPEPEPPPPSGGPNVLAITGFSLAGAGAIVGLVGGGIHLSKTSSLESQCEAGVCPATLADDHAAAGRWATISNVGFAVAGVGLAVGVIGLLTAPSSKAEPVAAARATPSLVPQVSVGLGGGSMRWTF